MSDGLRDTRDEPHPSYRIAELERQLAAEKERRVKYQDAVYAVCNWIDKRMRNGSPTLSEREELLARLGALFGSAELAREKAERDSWCDVCCGKGDPGTGNPCVCGGSGRASDAVGNLRRELCKAERERDEIAAALELHNGMIRTFSAFLKHRRDSWDNAPPSSTEVDAWHRITASWVDSKVATVILAAHDAKLVGPLVEAVDTIPVKLMLVVGPPYTVLFSELAIKKIDAAIAALRPEAKR
jgi:hypothetical protein